MTRKDLDKLRNNLPKYPGILGKTEYFNSAVLIPLVCIENEYHFLFEKRAENIRQGGEICFPGGQVDEDSDNSYQQTALRETFEEIGISSDKIEIIGRLDTLIGPRNVTVDSFVGICSINNIDECKIDTKEVAKIFTVPVKFFKGNSPENYKIISEFKYTFFNSNGEVENLIPSKKKSMNQHIDDSYSKSERHVLVYKYDGEVIWGITARLVYEVIKISS